MAAVFPAATDAGVDGTAHRPRKVIHIDMDAFFAAVEQRDCPELRGKPIAVGSDRARGVVATASYEARPFGVHSAMPSLTAKRLCPDLIFVKPRFEVYKAVSAQLRAIFARFTPLIEPLSLDEAYLDVTDNLLGVASATRIAKDIRALILAETGLTASAGVSYNKFLAKLASDYRKPDGLFVITPGMGAGFVARLPVEKFHGIGPATAARMHRLGIRTGADLATRDPIFLERQFGKAGIFYADIAHGIDGRPVRPDRIRKSIGAETTFATDLVTLAAAKEALRPLIAKVCRQSTALGLHGRTATLKVKYADFHQITRRHTEPAPIVSEADFERLSAVLLAPLFPTARGVRLLGVTLSSLDADGGDDRQFQLAL